MPRWNNSHYLVCRHRENTGSGVHLLLLRCALHTIAVDQEDSTNPEHPEEYLWYNHLKGDHARHDCWSDRVRQQGMPRTGSYTIRHILWDGIPFSIPSSQLWGTMATSKYDKKEEKKKKRNCLTSCFRSEKKVIKYKIIDLTSITSTDSEMFSSQYPTNIEMSETNLQEEKPKNFINRIQRFFRRMKTYFRH